MIIMYGSRKYFKYSIDDVQQLFLFSIVMSFFFFAFLTRVLDCFIETKTEILFYYFKEFKINGTKAYKLDLCTQIFC